MRPKKVPTLEWLRTEYVLPPEAGDFEGNYNPDYVPYLWGIWAAIDDPKSKIVAMMKAAQIGWTFGLVGYLCKRIAVDPTRIIGLFSKEGAAREFADEKLVPAVKSTPAMATLVDVSTSKSSGNRALFKKFPGGFLKLAGSNSASNVKSTPAGLVLVEEPDDTSQNVKDQGDAIRLVRERFKRSLTGKMILGGTPTLKGISRVEEYVLLGDQRVLPIECHDCGEKHPLDWENASCLDRDDGKSHEIYGTKLPETACYACPHCGSEWDDWQRQENIKNTVFKAAAEGDPNYGWVPTAEGDGSVISFKELNELYVCVPGTSLADVMRDYLQALHDAHQGDQEGLIVFINNKLARPYELKGSAPEVDELEARALDYTELTIPEGALVMTAGVDVQHDRLAVELWAWGPGEESWLVYWGELHAKHSTNDKADPVWKELDKLLFTPRKHERGFVVGLSAGSIDASDGQTSDTVYWYVRSRQARGIMAAKGSSNDYGTREIFARPKAIDHKSKTKAAKHGLLVYMVGTHKAKDLLIGDQGRITLSGSGPGRMHWYQSVRPDFYEQLTAEVKAPTRRMRGKATWQPKAGVRNEGLDCAVLALHAARSLKLHVWNDARWAALEQRLMQGDMFSQPTTVPAKPAASKSTPPSGNPFTSGNDWFKR